LFLDIAGDMRKGNAGMSFTTWNMTIEDRGTFRGRFRVDLPGREYMALRIRREDRNG
jgi:hypothetical protein